jgi:hypothetical protein
MPSQAPAELFCGPITDGGDVPDLRMAREYLARSIPNPLRAAAELARCRDAAQRLVRSQWAQRRIRVLADALLRCGTLERRRDLFVYLSVYIWLIRPHRLGPKLGDDYSYYTDNNTRDPCASCDDRPPQSSSLNARGLRLLLC